jgi:hypothetical protein
MDNSTKEFKRLLQEEKPETEQTDAEILKKVWEKQAFSAAQLRKYQKLKIQLQRDGFSGAQYRTLFDHFRLRENPVADYLTAKYDSKLELQDMEHKNPLLDDIPDYQAVFLREIIRGLDELHDYTLSHAEGLDTGTLHGFNSRIKTLRDNLADQLRTDPRL